MEVCFPRLFLGITIGRYREKIKSNIIRWEFSPMSVSFHLPGRQFNKNQDNKNICHFTVHTQNVSYFRPLLISNLFVPHVFIKKVMALTAVIKHHVLIQLWFSVFSNEKEATV